MSRISASCREINDSPAKSDHFPVAPNKASEVIALPRAYGLLPNRIACNAGLDGGGLVMLAARLTYAGPWNIKRRWAQGLVRRGLGERAYWRGIGSLVDCGLLERRREPNGRQGHGHVVNDEVKLSESEHCRRVEGRWFDGSLSVKALAMLLFLRANAEGEARPWHIERRFGWSLGTIKTAADELLKAGLIEAKGKPRQPVYRAGNSQEAQYKNCQSKFWGHVHTDQSVRTDNPVLSAARGPQKVRSEGTDGKAVAVFAGVRPQSFAERAAGPELVEAGGDRLPFSPDVIRQVAPLGTDVQALLTKFEEQANRKRLRGDRIRNPDGYLLEMALEEAARKAGLTRAGVEAIVAEARVAPRGCSTDAAKKADAEAWIAARLGGGAIGLSRLALLPDRRQRKWR